MALCSAIYFNCYLTWPAVKDLPYVIEGEYLTVEGYTDSSHNYKGGITSVRSFHVKNEEERVYIRAPWRGISPGVWVKINYLP